MEEEVKKMEEIVKPEKVGFFEEAPGVRSSQRLMYVIGMAWVMILVSYLTYCKVKHNTDISWTDLGIFAGVLFSIFTTGKLWQKTIEK